MLKNKVVVISGASSGIGRAAAVACYKQGAKLVLHYIGDSQSFKDITALHEELDHSDKVWFENGDISDPCTSEKIVNLAIEMFGRIDALVSNAGICEFAPFLDVTPEILSRHTEVNYHGSYYLIQAVARVMSTQKGPRGGSIISVSSISALVGGAEQTHYTPTKAALLNLMQSCAVSLGKYGIRCNAILPGTIQTDMNSEDLKDETKRAYMTSRCALGRRESNDLFKS